MLDFYNTYINGKSYEQIQSTFSTMLIENWYIIFSLFTAIVLIHLFFDIRNLIKTTTKNTLNMQILHSTVYHTLFLFSLGALLLIAAPVLMFVITALIFVSIVFVLLLLVFGFLYVWSNIFKVVLRK